MNKAQPQENGILNIGSKPLWYRSPFEQLMATMALPAQEKYITKQTKKKCIYAPTQHILSTTAGLL